MTTQSSSTSDEKEPFSKHLVANPGAESRTPEFCAAVDCRDVRRALLDVKQTADSTCTSIYFTHVSLHFFWGTCSRACAPCS